MIESLFNSPNYQMSKMMLDVSTQRQEALASNIANVDTPGYHRLDVSKTFETELQNHFKAGEPTASSLHQSVIAADPDARGTRADGNNVELDNELLKMGSNEMQYETLTEFVSNSLAQLKTAITGNVQ
ncbi:MAG: flagellar basal body rod protein FlgB [Chthoniobacteraceae bacterium]